MYTLYYSPGSCSLVVNALMRELDIPFELKRVDIEGGEHRGAEYRKVNPKGKVPALIAPEGTLTECVAIVEFLCDKHGGGALLAAPGTWQRAKTLEQVATLATEVHPLFNRYFHQDDFSDAKDVQDAVKARGNDKLLAWFREQDAALTGPYWSGEFLTAADIYFMVIARWGRWLTPAANEMRNIRPFYERMIARPAVARAFASEGIKAFGTH
jgi:glutathione S-transferase